MYSINVDVKNLVPTNDIASIVIPVRALLFIFLMFENMSFFFYFFFLPGPTIFFYTVEYKFLFSCPFFFLFS